MFFFQDAGNTLLAPPGTAESAREKRTLKVGTLTVSCNFLLTDRRAQPDSLAVKQKMRQLLFDEALDVLVLGETSFNTIAKHSGRLLKWDGQPSRELYHGYVMFSNTEQHAFGGVALVVKETCLDGQDQSFQAGYSKQSGLHFVKIRLSPERPYFGLEVIGVYRQAQVKVRPGEFRPTDLSDGLLELRSLVADDNTMILGDFNADWLHENIDFFHYLPGFTQVVQSANCDMGPDEEHAISFTNPRQRPTSSAASSVGTIGSDDHGPSCADKGKALVAALMCRQVEQPPPPPTPRSPTPLPEPPPLVGVCRSLIFINTAYIDWLRWQLGVKVQPRAVDIEGQGCRLVMAEIRVFSSLDDDGEDFD